MSDLIIQVIESTAGVYLLAVVVLLSFGLVMMALLIAGVMLRAVWRWMTHYTANDVMVFVERKALEQKEVIS